MEGTPSACEIENLPLQEFITNIGENLEKTNKDQEGASPKITSKGLLCEGWAYFVVGQSRIHAEGDVAHTEVTGDTGQWTSRHWQANRLNIPKLWAGTTTLGCGYASGLAPGGTTFISFPLLQDGGIDFSRVEDFRRL